jgi:HlyD family secretion protein
MTGAAVRDWARARRGWLIAAAVAVAALAGYAVYQRVQADRAQAAALAALRSETIVKGDILSTVGATGTLQPEQQASLLFLVPGTVSEVLVESGDTVRAGQPLARLDATELRLAVQQAADALAVAKLNRQKLTVGPTAADLAAARANVASANAALADLLKGSGAEEVSIAQLTQDQLQDAYQKAADRYNALVTIADKYFVPPLEVMKAAEDAMNNAALAAQIGRLQAQQLSNGPDQGTRSVGYARVAQAQAVLNQLAAPPGDLQMQQADLAVAQAELALAQAQLRLTRAELSAPFAGIIATVNVKAGEPAPAGTPAFVLIDPSHFHLDVAVDEVDVAQLTPGQAVSVTLDALPGATLTGQVDRLAPVAAAAGGIVNYSVRLVLDSSSQPLRASMSATANIAVAEARGVVLVPNWAIRRDRRTGQVFASLKIDGQLREVPIETGLRGENYTEVRSGVQVGDVAAVSTARDALNLFSGN